MMASGDSISSDVFSHASDDSLQPIEHPSDVGDRLLSGSPDAGTREEPRRNLPTKMIGGTCLIPAQQSGRRTRTQLLQVELNKKIQQLQEAQELQKAERDASRHEVRTLNAALEIKNREVRELGTEISDLREKILKTEDEELYPMNSQPHGKAIVIVNENFRTNPDNPALQLRKRSGAQKDLKCYEDMVRHLGYDVITRYDLKAMEMYEAIDEVAKENHEAFDSFICCISTHGDEQFMYGSDSVGVKRQEVFQPLKESPSLIRKPKMIFIQACRTKVETTTAESTSAAQAVTYCPDVTSKDADVFIANATTAHNSSYRSQEYGSWFVYALYRIFTTYADRSTLSQMMVKVNNVVCDRRGELREENQGTLSTVEVQQCAEYTTSFRMGLRFMKRHVPFPTHN